MGAYLSCSTYIILYILIVWIVFCNCQYNVMVWLNPNKFSTFPFAIPIEFFSFMVHEWYRIHIHIYNIEYGFYIIRMDKHSYYYYIGKNMFFIRIPSDLSNIKAILQPSRIDSRIPARKLTNDRKFRFFLRAELGFLISGTSWIFSFHTLHHLITYQISWIYFNLCINQANLVVIGVNKRK